MRTYEASKADPITVRSFSAPVSMITRLDAEREKSGLTLSELTRRAFELYLADRNCEPPKEKP